VKLVSRLKLQVVRLKVWPHLGAGGVHLGMAAALKARCPPPQKVARPLSLVVVENGWPPGSPTWPSRAHSTRP